MYVISNRKNFIGTDSKRYPKAVKSLHLALTFEKEEKAKNFLTNLPKEFRNIGYEIVEITEEKKEEAEVTDPITIEEIRNAVPLIENIIGKMLEQKEYVEQQIRLTDAETIDLLHYAEFNALNVVEGYKFYKRLHDLRIRRRGYKDVARMIGAVEHCSIKDISENALSQQLDTLDHREYAPRVLNDLFGGNDE